MTNQPQEQEGGGFCARCGTSNPHTAAFCVKCGAPLPWAAPKTEPAAPVAAEMHAPVPPPPPMMPPPPPMGMQAPTTPRQVASPASAPVQPVAPNTPTLPAGVPKFVSDLKADVASQALPVLVRRYAWHLVALAVLLFVLVRMASTLVVLAAVGAAVCLFVGLKDPEKFRPLFGARTSKATVGWTFGLATLVLMGAADSSLQPPAATPAADVAPLIAPVTSAAPVSVPVPTSAPVQKTAAQVRAEAAKARVARAQAKARQDVAEKVAQQKQAERERVAADLEAASKEDRDLPSKSAELPSNVTEVNIPGVGKRQVGVVDKVEYAVLSVEKVASIGRTQADGVFYLLHVVASNTAKKAHSIATVRMKMVDDQEREFSASGAGNTELLMQGDQGAQFLTAKLQPGVVKKFTLVFDAPDDATGLALQIPKGAFSFGKSARIQMPTASE